MDSVKYKFLSFIHRSNSYFAKKIRDYLPKSWKNILCDYELFDLNSNVIQTAKFYESQDCLDDSSSNLESDYGSDYENDKDKLRNIWKEGCPNEKLKTE